MLGRGRVTPGRLHGWSWGTMRYHPFQPRVVYRQTVLSSARWLLPPRLIKASRVRERWPQAIKAWQIEDHSTLPNIVVIEDGDRLLPLDLREDDDRELLRRHVGRGARSVIEQPGGPDAVHAVLAGPAGDHVLEVVLSLGASRRLPSVCRIRHSRGLLVPWLHLPGGEWLSAAVRCPAHLHEEARDEPRRGRRSPPGRGRSLVLGL